MFISVEDYRLLMSLIESEIHHYKLNHDKLRDKELVKKRQLQLFKKWIEPNHTVTPNGHDRFYGATKERELKSWLVDS